MACNIGLAAVKGEYIARIDSDDIWEPDKLERQLRFMESREDCKICFTNVNIIDEFGNSLNEQESGFFDLMNKPEMTREENLRFFFEYGNYLAHPSVMIKTEFQREVGRYNLAYCQAQDFDYWIRAVKKTYLYKMPDRLIKFRRFVQNKERNLSAQTEKATIRWFNEYMIIRGHFFDDMSDELFASAFREMFRNPSACTPEEYACEKAFLLRDRCRLDNRQYAMLGRFAMERLFEDEKLVRVLEETYHYTPMDYYEEMKELVFLNPIVDRKVEVITSLQQEKQELERCLSTCRSEGERKDQEIEGLKRLNGELQEALETMRSSACWKMTSPVRKVLDCLKR